MDEQKTPSAKKLKKSPGRKLLDILLSDDPGRIATKVENEVLKPGLKNLGYEILLNTLNMIFGKAPRTGYTNGQQPQQNGIIQYSSYYQGGRPMPVNPMRPSYDYGTIIFSDKSIADARFAEFMTEFQKYGQIRVSDLNRIAGVSGTWTDNYWGWRNLQGARVELSPDGWTIVLPPCETL